MNADRSDRLVIGPNRLPEEGKRFGDAAAGLALWVSLRTNLQGPGHSRFVCRVDRDAGDCRAGV